MAKEKLIRKPYESIICLAVNINGIGLEMREDSTYLFIINSSFHTHIIYHEFI